MVRLGMVRPVSHHDDSRRRRRIVDGAIDSHRRWRVDGRATVVTTSPIGGVPGLTRGYRDTPACENDRHEGGKLEHLVHC